MAKTYSDEEVQKILSKSLRLQEESKTGAGGSFASSGLDADEIREIAREVGISEEFLNEALSSAITSLVLHEEKGFLGVTKLLKISGTINSELNEQSIMAIARETRKSLKKRGFLETVGNSFDWASKDTSENDITIEGDSSKGGSELRLMFATRNAKSLFYFLPMLAAFMFMGIVAKEASGAAGMIIPGMLIVAALVSHFGFKTYYNGKKALLIELFQRLEEIIASKATKPVEEEAEEANLTSDRRVDLDSIEGYKSTEPELNKIASKPIRRIP